VATLAALGALAAWAVLLSPSALGGPASYVIVSGTSMRPTLEQGDLVIVRKRAAYEVGDVVAYRVPKGEPAAGSLVIHRVVGGSDAAGWQLRGDNRTGDDLWRPPSNLIAGELWLHVPAAGEVLLLLRRPLPLAAVAALLVFLFVVTAARESGGSRPAPRLPASRAPASPARGRPFRARRGRATS
jgi:signal peptidase I